MTRMLSWRARRAICWIGGLCVSAALVSCDQTESIDGVGGAAALPGPAGSREPEESCSIFTSRLAGSWYPAGKQELADEIDGYLSKVPDERLEEVCAVILPHAGYRWSGPTGAYAVHQIQRRSFERVLVIGPSHRVPIKNVASVPDFTHYATPLGRVPLDRKFIAELRKHSEFQNIPSAHEDEHSVQIELPLLQRALDGFQFVPIVVGELDRPTMREMGRILRGLIDSQTLVVASSDFTHYGADFAYLPFTDDVPNKLKELDAGALDKLCGKDLDGLFDYIEKTGATICGRYAIGVLLSMLPADAQVHQLHYDTSGRMLGDFSSSVSYCALAVSGKWSEVDRVAPAVEPELLTAADRARLLRLARGSLTHVLKNREMPTVEQLDVEITPAIKRISGAFVTLHKNGELRGCIGEVFPSRPLFESVMAQAVNAGLNDHRFPQVELSELDEIDVEVSVLTPPRPVASASEIVVGRHGVVLKKAGHAALFLPQVATEQGWDRQTTLTHLSRKAGLAGDAWREDASFEVFEAIVFGEKDKLAKPVEK